MKSFEQLVELRVGRKTVAGSSKYYGIDTTKINTLRCAVAFRSVSGLEFQAVLIDKYTGQVLKEFPGRFKDRKEVRDYVRETARELGVSVSPPIPHAVKIDTEVENE